MTSSPPAMHIELYVPATIPMRKAKAKLLMTSPPQMYIAMIGSSVVSEVLMVRESVWLMDLFTSTSMPSVRTSDQFSLTRSRTTIESFSE